MIFWMMDDETNEAALYPPLLLEEHAMKLISALSALLLTTSAWATPDLLVNSVKMPAWVERNTQRLPLTVGMELHNGDTVITGENSRVLLNAADGSNIKLGAQARLIFSDLAQHKNEQPLFSAALNVLQGAFRFTTHAAAKLRNREVVIKVASATIGIRGTDVWGKAAATDKDIVCLIEGKISVNYLDQPAFAMEEPLSFYQMPKSAPPAAVAKVDLGQLQKWAAETEIAPGQGASRLDGHWKLDLMTVDNESLALNAYDELRTAGYAVRIVPLQTGRYSLRISQLPSRTEALALASQLTGKMGITAPVVTR